MSAYWGRGSLVFTGTCVLTAGIIYLVHVNEEETRQVSSCSVDGAAATSSPGSATPRSPPAAERVWDVHLMQFACQHM